ncbi:MAG: hypothetical protein AABM43_04790 [Actinomycetota bacterium]
MTSNEVPEVVACPLHRHRSYRTLARCLWPEAIWVAGNGPWASLAYCNVLTVELYRTEASALLAKRAIDQTACGGRCYGDHRFVYLERQR